MATETELINDELSLHEKLIKELKDNIDVEIQKLLGMMRQLIFTEQTVEKLKDEQNARRSTK